MLFRNSIPKIIMEAKKKIIIKPDKDTSDYTDEDNTDDTDSDPDEDTTTTEEDVTPGDDNEKDTDETDDPDANTDYTDEDTDDTGDDSDPDAIGDETSTDESVPVTDLKKNAVLLKDFISLYNLITSTIDRLSNVKKGDLLLSSIIVQIIKNLSITEKQIFNYIHSSLSKASYVSNLYQYNYFIEALKINIEMMKKIKNLDGV